MPIERPHFCFPPEAYPQGVGPGSQWACGCGNVWEAVGIQPAADYPATRQSPMTVIMQPERWRLVHGQCQPDEQDMYDFRSIPAAIFKLLEREVYPG